MVLWTDAIPATVVDMARTELPPGYRLDSLPAATPAAARERIGAADFLLVTGPLRIDGDLLDAAHRLRLVVKSGAGYEMLDLDALRQRRLPCCYTPGANAIAVAEHTLLLILGTLRRAVRQDQRLRQGHFAKWELRTTCHEAWGAHLGLVGFGAIGRAVAERARGFGMRIAYCNRHRLDAAAEDRLGVHYLPLPELLEQCDIVSLHVPLTAATRHLIGAAELRRMQPQAVLINTARGAVVDEAALVQALAAGWIAGAGLDVFDPEPPAADHPLWRFDQVMVTPHSASATVETYRRTLVAAFDLMQRFDAGQELPPAATLVPVTPG